MTLLLSQPICKTNDVNLLGEQVIEPERWIDRKPGHVLVLLPLVCEQGLLARAAPQCIDIHSLPHRGCIAASCVCMKRNDLAAPMMHGDRLRLDRETDEVHEDELEIALDCRQLGPTDAFDLLGDVL